MMRSILLFTFFEICFSLAGFGQLPVPYSNSFDAPSDETDWTHFAITGTDDWEMGTPSGTYINSAFSQPGAWKTNLDGAYAGSSSRVLVSPEFDFTSIPSNYSLNFYQRRHSNSTASYFLEYSINNGATWAIFNPTTTLKKNWQTASGFANGTSSTFFNSAINLISLQGQASVRFRFRFNSNFVNGEGWLIDDFSISEEYYNIYGVQGDTIWTSAHCSDFTVSTTVGFANAYAQSVNNTTKYYFSQDNVFDAGDIFLGTRVGGITSSVVWDKSFAMIPNLNAGDYYIFYQHDANNVLVEDIESDNISYAILHLDSIYAMPYNDDFESDSSKWQAYLQSTGILYWEHGSGYSHHLEGAHSGKKAWHTSKSVNATTTCGYSCNTQYLESPYFDLSSTSNPVLSFYYKCTSTISIFITLQGSSDCGNSWTDIAYIAETSDGQWHPLIAVVPVGLISEGTKFRIKYMDHENGIEGIAIDDFYIGADLPDLSIELDLNNRNTQGSESNCDIKYFLTNYTVNGSIGATETHFYWSTDTILDASDIFVGIKNENPLGAGVNSWVNYVFTKPTTATGSYYLFYKLDGLNVVAETREDNNIGYFTIYQNQSETVPYFNNFETSIDGWHHNSTLTHDDWQWGIPDGMILNSAFSGDKAIFTANDSNYVSPMSRMHLYTPVFDFTTAQSPVIFFDMLLDADGNCSCYNANTNMSYSTDGGATWELLDTMNSSYNRWYYSMVETGWGNDENYYLANTTNRMIKQTSENVFASYGQYNSKDVSRNTRYVLDVSFLSGEPSVQFKYNLVTDRNFYNQPNLNYQHKEGALIDDFGIAESFIDLEVEYKKALMVSSEADNLSFFMWIKNNGLSISNATNLKFYTSVDTILDGTDYLLGTTSLNPIRPDMNAYVNRKFGVPDNFVDYKYLLYSIDPANLNSEVNELNNIGYWELALDSIHEYPYFNEFNDTIVDGWYQYSSGPYGDTISNLRFRNQIAPGEPLYHSYKRSGEWFTDRSTFGNGSAAPKFFLQSPAFSFENVDSVKLSFDLFCTWGSVPGAAAGGQMQFSTDGGDNFTILSPQYGAHHNWYNFTGSTWGLSNIYLDTAILDSTYFDLTFLRGEKNVVFQYTFMCNEIQANVPQGMRMDNFLIEGIQLDYIALDSMVDVSANISVPTIDIDYSIANIGDKHGRESVSKFYWSQDSLWDQSDVLLDSVDHEPILMNDTISGQINLTYPTPISAQQYFILYRSDVDNNVKESHENNNLGTYRVLFDAFINYKPAVALDSVIILDTETTVTVDYEIENAGYLDGANFSTKFYWSLDNVLDVNDELLTNESLSGIAGQNSVSSTVDVNCPLPFVQAAYYVLYVADENNVISESNETDNLGKLKVIIQSTASVSEDGSIQLIGVNGNSVFINVPVNQFQNSELVLTNMVGQTIMNTNLHLQNGVNEIKLPESLVYGMYMLYLDNPKSAVGWKIITGSNY